MRPRFIAFSPTVQLAAPLGLSDNECVVSDLDAFPDVGEGEYGYITILFDRRGSSQDPADYETCTYTGKDIAESKLTGLTRGVEGEAQAWVTDTYCLSSKTAHSDEVVWQAIDGLAYGNWDGGKADSVYGGMDAINGGSA